MADSIPKVRIQKAEKRLGFPIPSALRDFLWLAGQSKENRFHNRLFMPEELLAEDGYFLFMEEYQAVVHWCIPLALIKRADPEVYQRVNSDEPEWYSEDMTLSEFIIKNLEWQFGLHAVRQENEPDKTRS
jgi:hypothetical protein